MVTIDFASCGDEEPFIRHHWDGTCHNPHSSLRTCAILGLVMNDVIEWWGDLHDPRMAMDLCSTVSRELMRKCRALKVSSIIVNSDRLEHHWLWVDGINIDLTARQYMPHSPFPLVWLSIEPHESNHPSYIHESTSC